MAPMPLAGHVPNVAHANGIPPVLFSNHLTQEATRRKLSRLLTKTTSDPEFARAAVRLLRTNCGDFTDHAMDAYIKRHLVNDTGGAISRQQVVEAIRVIKDMLRQAYQDKLPVNCADTLRLIDQQVDRDGGDYGAGDDSSTRPNVHVFPDRTGRKWTTSGDWDRPLPDANDDEKTMRRPHDATDSADSADRPPLHPKHHHHHHHGRHHHHPHHHHHRRRHDHQEDETLEWHGRDRKGDTHETNVNVPPSYLDNYERQGQIQALSHRGRHRHQQWGEGPDIWWLMMLPFVCIGMYVSIKTGVAAYRKRRDVHA